MSAAAWPRVVVTGMGVVCSTAVGVPAFEEALRAGRSGIARLASPFGDRFPAHLGAEIRDFFWAEHLDRLGPRAAGERARARDVLRNATPAVRVGVAAALEAFCAAGLDHLPAPREDIALIVAGHNLEQRHAFETAERFLGKSPFVNPRYAIASLDSSLLGAVSAVLSLRGVGFLVGGASASGGVGIANGFQLVRTGQAPACLVLGAMTDLSALELEALRGLGALGGGRFLDSPDEACRPFDRAHEGFIVGQASAALVLESSAHAAARGAIPLAEVAGAATLLDGNHLTDPSVDGEARVMRAALRQAGIRPADVQYLSAHATSTPLGDAVECAAIRAVFEGCLDGLIVNATKSLVGHALTAAGVVELVASVLQMNGGFVHPSRNLCDPIDDLLHFAGSAAAPTRIDHALSNSFGFGGVTSSVVLRRPSPLDHGAHPA